MPKGLKVWASIFIVKIVNPGESFVYIAVIPFGQWAVIKLQKFKSKLEVVTTLDWILFSSIAMRWDNHRKVRTRHHFMSLTSIISLVFGLSLIEWMIWYPLPGETARRFDCGFCSRSFTRRSALRIHRIAFHSDSTRSFLCPECGSAFKSSSALYEHRKRVHLRYAQSSLSLSDPKIMEEIFKEFFTSG